MAAQRCVKPLDRIVLHACERREILVSWRWVDRCAGALMLAPAVDDPALSDEIVTAARGAFAEGAAGELDCSMA